jgi:hypothetical protein
MKTITSHLVFISPAQKAQFAHANVKSGNFSPLAFENGSKNPP